MGFLSCMSAQDANQAQSATPAVADATLQHECPICGKKYASDWATKAHYKACSKKNESQNEPQGVGGARTCEFAS